MSPLTAPNYEFLKDMPPSIKRILNYFPEFTHESKLIQSMAIGDYEEIRSRLFDLIDQLSENSTGVQANDTGVIFWEEALGLISNPSDSIELKRSNILSKTIRKNRIRNVDIGNIVRLFTIGPRTFTRQQITKEINIPISSLEGFGEGQQIYVGPTLVTIVSVDVGNRLFIVDSPVTAHAYAAVTTKLITVSETFPNYTFNILFNPGDIEDTTAMNEAVEQAKPAHLGFATQTLWSPFIWDSEVLEGWNKSEIADIAGYWDLDQLTGDMIDISGKGNDGVVTLGAGTRGVSALSPLSQTDGEACMTFDGVDSKIQMADAVPLQNIFDGEGFFALKFNVNSDGEGTVSRLIDKRWRLIVRDEAGGNIRLLFIMNFDSQDGNWQTAVNIPINADHEIIVRYNADAVGNDPIFILDSTELTVGSGLTRTLTPIGTRVTDVGDDLVIGNSSGQTTTVDGEVDEVMLSGDGITTIEAQAWYATHLVDEMNTKRLGPRFF